MYEKFKVPFDTSVCAVCSFEKGEGSCRKPLTNRNLIKKDKDHKKCFSIREAYRYIPTTRLKERRF